MSLIKSADQLQEYFIQLCREHISIRHTDTKPRFYQYKEKGVGKNMNYPCVVWVPPVIGLIDRKSDNIHEAPDFELWILQPMKLQDSIEQKKIVNECDSIACDFIARLIKDRSGFEKERQFSELDINTIKRTETGPYGTENAHGIALYGSLAYPKNFSYDATKWKK